MAAEIREGLCGICPAGCWVRSHLDGGMLTSVEALPDHPLGMVCRIGRHAPEIVHDPQRLRHPMRRVGPKGRGEFERISWDEAFETIVERLEVLKRESGPESTAIYTGRGSFDMALCDLFQPAGVAVSSASSVLFPFGSPNTLGVGALCYVSFAMIAPHVTMGEMYITMDTDLDQAEMVVVWGANPATDSPPLAQRQILNARARGAQVVVIDPRRSETAVQAEAEWVPLRPGTDGALALGMINVLLEEELCDEAFTQNWTHGFDELDQMVQHYRPDVVESITGVRAETVRSLARRIASARGASPVMYSGLEYSDSGVQAIRAVFVLWALAGQLDVPGGLVIRMRDNVFPQNRSGLISNPDVRLALGRDRFPVYSMYRGESHAIALPESVLEGKPYRIRGLIILGGSIITSWPQPGVWKKTLEALDFLVSIDRYPTADSAYADLVLPATTGFEMTSYMRYGPLFKIRERLVEPQGEARSDFVIVAELARRLGYGHLYPQSEEDVLRHALQGTGFTLEEVREAGGAVQLDTVMTEYRKWEKGLLRADGEPGFETPTGKLEIASTILAEHGYDPLPVYTEPAEGPLTRPDLARQFPLVFNSGSRTYYDFRSQHHGVPGLAKKLPEPLVTINADDAAVRGIEDGDLVELSTPRGSVTLRARVTDGIVKGAVDASMGGGGPLGSKAWQECNVNELTDLQRYDPISGFPVYKTLLCEVSKIGEVGLGDVAARPGAPGSSAPGNGDEALLRSRSSRSRGEETSDSGDPRRAGEIPEHASGAPGDVKDPWDTTIAGRRLARPPEHRQSRPPPVPETEQDTEHFILAPARPRRHVYLDTSATTAVLPDVLDAMLPFLSDACGNPSSIHARGGDARAAVESARRSIAHVLNTTARRIVFTGSGSESDNLAIKGIASAHTDRGRHVVTSSMEHPAVLSACRALEEQGYRVTYVEVDSRGTVAPDDLARALRDDTILVSVMMANNEIGTVQRIGELAAIAHGRGAFFHTDAVQALGKIPIDVDELAVDLLSVSAHKIHGPKGIGALYSRRGVELRPLVDGGGQEFGLRSGTENVPGIVGFGRACELAAHRLAHGEMDRLAGLRDHMEAGIRKLVDGARRNGDPGRCLPTVLNVTLPRIRGEALVIAMDRRGVCFSSGSACKSGNPNPSHVLKAIGLSDEEAHCSVRFSLGADTTGEDIDYALECLEEIIRDTRSAIRFVSCR